MRIHSVPLALTCGRKHSAFRGTAVSGLGKARECLKWRLCDPCTKSAPCAVPDAGVLRDTEPAAAELAKGAPARPDLLSQTSVPRENLHYGDPLFCLFGDDRTFLKRKRNFFSDFFFQFVRVGSLSALCQTGLHRFCEDDGG